MPTNIALLVHACDRYELLYKGFEHFFNQHWDFSIDAQYYFATEEKEATVKGFTNIRSGKGEWADRLVILLKAIPQQYVLYFQEDMWLNKPVNAAFFNQLFQQAAANNWQQVKLHSSDVYRTIPTGQFIEGFALTKLDNEASDFLMSHQVTLWDKNFLIAQLHKGEHPWRNERRGTKRLKKLNPDIYQLDYFAENGAPAINQNQNPIGRSEYQTISVNGILNHNAVPYIEVLKQAPGYEAYGEKLQHNYTHEITHDGLPKPRKVGAFKQLKNKLRGK